MTEPLAEFNDRMIISNPFEMREALRKLVTASGMSRRQVDELAGLPLGYTDKLLCEPPIRNIGPTSFFPLLWALSQRIVFVPDPASRSRIMARETFETRDERKARGDEHWRNAKALRMMGEIARKTGSAGGRKAVANMTPEQIRRQRQKAANARWRAFRRRKRLSLERAQESAALAAETSPKARRRDDALTSTV